MLENMYVKNRYFPQSGNDLLLKVLYSEETYSDFLKKNIPFWIKCMYVSCNEVPFQETIASSLNYISQNFEDIYPSEEFLEIPLMKIKAILSSDELNVQSELVAFDGMLIFNYWDLNSNDTDGHLWYKIVVFS